ncbi:MAG: TetR/AcrR family transcriptional regulator [Melioribacteraceae bacterium]
MPRTKEQFEEIRKNTRHSILENALELFAEKGFKGTSISDIAKAAGVSKGLTYNYFKSKNDLMFAVFSLLEEKMGEAFFEMEKVEDSFKKLKTMINLMFKFLKEDEKFWQLYMNFTFQPEVQTVASEFMTEFLSGIFFELEKLFRQMGVENPKEESKILAAIFDGIGFHYILEKEKYPLDKMRRFLIKKYSKDNLILK